jgi:sec-independent protein translocase protein TatC
MLFLAVPMTVLYLVSEVIARLTDRRKAKSAAS